MATAARSDIQVFFRAFGSDEVVRAMRRISSATASITRGVATSSAGIARGVVSGIQTATSSAIGAITSLGGAPIRAFNMASSAISSILGKVAILTGAMTGLGFTIFRVGSALASLQADSAELTSVVLALRSLNSEIASQKELPLFGGDTRQIRDQFGNIASGLKVINDSTSSKTADDLAYLNKQAFLAGVPVKSLAKDYISLQASTTKANITLDESRGIFTGISNAALVMGRSADESHRAFVALQQIASKGQVYAEELKGQLAEALPGIVPEAAKAFGQSVKQFNESVAAGQVSAVEFFRKLGKQLNKDYGEAAKAASDTTRVAIGRLANAFFNAKVIIGNGALDNTLKSIIKSATNIINQLIDNGALKRFGQNLANAIQPIADYLKAGENDLTPFVKALDFAATGVRKLVDAVGVIGRAFSLAIQTFRSFREDLQKSGIEVPSLGEAIIGVFTTIAKTADVINNRNFSDSPFANFLASLFVLAEQAGAAVLRLFAGPLRAAADNTGGVLQGLADTIGQVAAAIKSLSTGSIDPTLNLQGLRFLETFIGIRDTIDSMRGGLSRMVEFVGAALTGLGRLFGFIFGTITGNLVGRTETAGQSILRAFDITDTKKAWQDFLVLISGGDAGLAVDSQLDALFSARSAIAALVSGNAMPRLFDSEGNEFQSIFLEKLFQIRDTVIAVFNFALRGASLFRGALEGASAAVNVVLGTLAIIGAILDAVGSAVSAVGEAIGFPDLLKALGYAAGFLFVMERVRIAVIAIGAILRGTAIVGALASIGALVGQIVAQLGLGIVGMGALGATFGGVVATGLVFTGIIGGIAFILYEWIANFRLINSEAHALYDTIAGGVNRAMAGFLRLLGDLLGKLPNFLGGSYFKKNAYDEAARYEANAKLNDQDKYQVRYRNQLIDDLKAAGLSYSDARAKVFEQIDKTGYGNGIEGKDKTLDALQKIVADRTGEKQKKKLGDSPYDVRAIADAIRQAQTDAGMVTDETSALNKLVQDNLQAGGDMTLQQRIASILQGNNAAVSENTDALGQWGEYLRAYQNGETPSQQAFDIREQTRQALSAQQTRPQAANDVDDSPLVLTDYERQLFAARRATMSTMEDVEARSPNRVLEAVSNVNAAGIEAANANVESLRSQVAALQGDGYRQPIALTLDNGQQVTVLADTRDAQTLAEQAARQAAPKAQGAAGWM